MIAFINHALTFTNSRDLLQIQGDSRGNINILGSDNIGRCKENKVHMSMSLILNSNRNRAVGISRPNSVRF